MNMGKLWIDSTPLEISGKKMNQGDAYIFFRGDDSFMIYQPLESIGGRWFMQKWFDFYRYKLDVRTTISCILDPIDKDVKKKDLKECTGISYSTIRKLENSENVNVEVLEKICRALNCTFDDIAEIVPSHGFGG